MSELQRTGELWSYSLNEELYHGQLPSRLDAIEECLTEHDLRIGDCFWVGRSVEPDYMIGCPDAADILEEMGIAIYDRVGDVSEGWPDATDSQLGELTEAIRATVRDWFEKYGLKPEFWAIEDAEQIEVTEELLATVT